MPSIHVRTALTFTLALCVATARADAAPSTASDGDAETAATVKQALDQDRADRRAERVADFRYKEEAITFGDLYIATTDSHGTSVSHSLLPYRGGRQLSPEEFYLAVDRPDLAATFLHRTHVGVGVIIAGSLVTVGGVALMLVRGLPTTNSSSCDPTSSSFSPCFAAEQARDAAADAQAAHYRNISYGILGGGAVLALVGSLYLANRNPASREEVYDLADGYNARLRHKYQLPSASLRPHVQQVAWAPYAAADGAGLELSGRF